MLPVTTTDGGGGGAGDAKVSDRIADTGAGFSFRVLFASCAVTTIEDESSASSTATVVVSTSGLGDDAGSAVFPV